VVAELVVCLTSVHVICVQFPGRFNYFNHHVSNGIGSYKMSFMFSEVFAFIFLSSSIHIQEREKHSWFLNVL
jgi:hypothetical protein